MSGKNLVKITSVLLLALWFSCSGINAQSLPPLPNPWNNQIGNWSFEDTNWYSDFGYAPVSFTNLDNPAGFDGNALQVDSTNAAWLQYNIIEDDSFENLTFDQGTIELWVLPNWNSATNGGTGLGDWGRLIDVGAYSTNATSSWWSLYFTPDGNNLCFSSETNGVFTNYLNFPISWDSSTWHLVSLTYDQSQSQLYIDGQLATNGAGVAYLPSASVVSNGFFVGSDHTGMQQAHAQIDDLSTYNYVIWAAAITNDYAAGMNLISPPDIGILRGGFGGGFGMDDSSDSFGSLYGANLWLQITNVSGGLVFANLMNATNYVYAILSTTNLAIPSTNWSVATELFPTGDQTNVMPFTVPTLGQPILFLKAEDWTGVTENGNTTPDWWFWEYYGTTALSDTNLDSQGYPLIYDYTNSYDPNIISFSISLPYNYVNTNYPNLPLTIFAGVPSSVAVLVNDTNLADAVWQPYTSSNVVATLGADGNYNVSVGLRGLPTNATASWQSVAIIKDTVEPTLVITNPTTSSVSQATVQFQGYASKPLASLTYDISNATGIFTNQTGYLTSQFYDTNLPAFTTNYFQCPDVGLGNGINTITLHAADWEGNRTNASFTLNYSASTNPPALTIIWPPTGTAISGSSFTVQAQVDNPAASITATIADASGDTNTVQGLVEKNGSAWVQNLPLNAGTNTVTVTATGVSSNASVTSFNVIKNDVGLVIYPLESYQLNQSSVSVFGEVGDPSLCVWVNGIQAAVNDDGTWEADNVPVSPAGTACLSVQVFVGDPVLVASQNLYQPQPVTVGLMSYSGSIHEDSQSFGGEWFVGNNYSRTVDDVANWFYLSGGNDLFHDTTTDPENPPVENYETDYAADSNGVPPAFFNPPWEYAQTSFGWDDTYYGQIMNGNFSVRTHVMIEQSGQEPAGQTNLYLVLANASEVSDVTRDEAFTMFGYLVPVDPSWWYGNVPLPPEWLQIKGQTLVNTGLTNTDGSTWGCTVIQASSGANVDVTPVATQVNENWDYTFDVKAINFYPPTVDANRDGQIALDGSDATTAAKPCRFWVNDVSESGDISTAADAVPGSSSPNCSLNQINGRSDLVNFFPVALCLSNVLQLLPLTNGFEYHLSQADSAVKFVYSGLNPTNAFDYLTNTASTGYGTNFNEDVTSADTIQVTNSQASGTILDTNWLTQIQNNGGNAVILMEGCATSTAPLVLEIWGTNTTTHQLQLVAGAPMYLSISGVEQMYRWVNLRHVVGAAETRATDTNEPANNLDTQNLKGNFVFVHGYNVNESQARGWNAEMFKRLYQADSKAKFYAVDWDGSQSQGDYVSGDTANYQTNVVNAFLTAPYLATFINGLSSSTVLAGHSLGNMVCLSAISDSGATPSQYFMIDAAVPMEAIDGSMPINNDIVNTNVGGGNWLAYYQQLWASEWYNLWTNTDARSTLTWNNRLGNLGSVDIYNFYSSGEDVLRDYPGNPPSSLFTLFGEELVGYIFGDDLGTYVWAWQEKNKGLMSGNSILSSNHGGWRFNAAALNPKSYTAYTVDMANAIPPSQLQTNAFFDFGWHTFGSNHPDYDHLQVTDSSGSDYAVANRNRILSDAIPALTLPIGANYVTNLDNTGLGTRNFDMQANYENSWPPARLETTEGNNWHHSDLVNVAYPFTSGLFNAIVNAGNLK